MSKQRAEYRLTEKQKRFADEYLIDCNATQAAIRAGYSPKTAYSIGEENLKKPGLKAYIEEQLAKLHTARTADAQEVMEYLTSLLRGEQREQVLRFVGEGVQELVEIDVAARERLKAAELLGKRYGLFTDKVNLSAKIPVFVGEGDFYDED